MIANALLYFNEYIDDKQLGLWLKSTLDSTNSDETHDQAKDEIISNYMYAWKIIHSAYHMHDNSCNLFMLSNAGLQDSILLNIYVPHPLPQHVDSFGGQQEQ